MKTVIIDTLSILVPAAGIVYAVFAASFGIGVVSFFALVFVIKIGVKN